MSLICNSCAYLSQDRQHCALTSWVVNPSENSCFRHSRSITVCDVCGSIILGSKIIELNKSNQWHIICPTCNQKMGTCQICDKSGECLFQTDPSSLPKSVQKTIRQGNMVMQTAVRNPEREKITCTKCNCWRDDECMKESGWCENYYHTY